MFLPINLLCVQGEKSSKLVQFKFVFSGYINRISNLILSLSDKEELSIEEKYKKTLLEIESMKEHLGMYRLNKEK